MYVDPRIAGSEGAGAGTLVGDPPYLGLLASSCLVGGELLVGVVLLDRGKRHDGEASGRELFEAAGGDLVANVLGDSPT
jgi:hypothetical protein